MTYPLELNYPPQAEGEIIDLTEWQRARINRDLADGKVYFTTFFNKYATEKREESLPIDELAKKILDQRAKEKDHLPFLKLAHFGNLKTDKGSLRHDDNLLLCTGCESDYDAGSMPMEDAERLLRNTGIRTILYASPSNTPTNHRWRAVCPFSEALPPSDRDKMMDRLNGVLKGAIAGESWVRSQSYYYGSVRGNHENHRVVVIEGAPIDKLNVLDFTAKGRPNGSTSSATGAHDAGHRETSDQGQRGKLFDVLAALAVIPNEAPELDRGWWVRIGHAVHAATDGGQAGFEAFDEWSKRHPTYSREANHTFWQSAHPDHIGMGTLVYEARKAAPGWELPSKIEVARAPRPATNDNEAKTPKFVPVWFDDIEPSLKANDFVQDLLVENSSVVVYGDSNTGKTFWLVDLMLHVAAGAAWNGRAVEQGAVIYCVLEGGHVFRNRIKAWKITHPDARNIPFAVIQSGINMLDPKADVPELIEAIKAAAETVNMPVKAIVIDTLARAMAGGNENAPDDMGALVMNMDAVRAATGAALIFVHHCGKDQAKGARGHSSLRAALDTEIEVTEVTGGTTKAATVVKQRDLAKGQSFGFSLHVVEIGTDDRGRLVTSCVPKQVDVADVKTRAKEQKAEEKKEHLSELDRGWLKDIMDAFAKPGMAVLRSPETGMSKVMTISRSSLQSWLVEKNRLVMKAETVKGGAVVETLPHSQVEKMSTRLAALRDKRKLCCNRYDVWLPERVDAPSRDITGL
jgi:hypothetical protein